MGNPVREVGLTQGKWHCGNQRSNASGEMSVKEKLRIGLFVWRVKRALRKFPDVREIHFDSQEFVLRMKAPREETMFLHNVYEEYIRHGWNDQSSIIQQHVESVLLKPETPETFEEAKPLLRPRIRERSYFEATDLSVRLANPGTDSTPMSNMGSRATAFGHLELRVTCPGRIVYAFSYRRLRRPRFANGRTFRPEPDI